METKKKKLFIWYVFMVETLQVWIVKMRKLAL